MEYHEISVHEALQTIPISGAKLHLCEGFVKLQQIFPKFDEILQNIYSTHMITDTNYYDS